MKELRRIFRRLEAVMAAAAFAEAGEAETARSILKKDGGKSSLRHRMTVRKPMALKPNHS